MSTSLTPKSRIIKAIQNHIETGIPIDSYNLTQEETRRMRAVAHLYKVWRKNPRIDKRAFLMEVHNRRTQDLPNDFYCFDFIRSLTVDMLLSKDELRVIQQNTLLDAIDAAKQTGDVQNQLKGTKQLGEFIKDMPEQGEERHVALEDFYTTNVQDVAPDFVRLESKARRAILDKYGGKPDANTQLIEDKVQALLDDM